MPNPFDDEPDTTFHVLVNDDGRHSLWPAHLAVPHGWQVVLADRDRHACGAYIDARWTDMRPVSLQRHASAPRT